MAGSSGAGETTVIKNAKETLRALRELDPDLRKALTRDLKNVSKPMVESMKLRIKELAPPLGSLDHDGRTSWENGKYKNSNIKPENVIAKLSSGRSRRMAITSLFAVWVRSPMVAIIGVAGQGSMAPRKPVTREYEWRGTKRRHTNNGQGRGLLSHMRNHGEYNWFYREAEKTMPSVERQVKLTWEEYSKKVSRKLK